MLPLTAAVELLLLPLYLQSVPAAAPVPLRAGGGGPHHGAAALLLQPPLQGQGALQPALPARPGHSG